MKPKYHELKIDPEPFEQVWYGNKKAEIRDLSDRFIETGDIIILKEFFRDKTLYSGASISVVITHIQRNYGLLENYAVLSFEVMNRFTSPDELKEKY